MTSAPFYCTKAMQCLVKFWRTEGAEISVFIDDGLGSNEEEKSNLHSLRE